MASEKCTRLKQEAAGFSAELKEVLVKLESIREKISVSMDHSSIEKNVYRHIKSEISNAEGSLIIAQETLLGVLEAEDKAELLNYLIQYD
jgi:hypothetical protein